ncbi:cupredoxin domain-containing protein [Aestuariivirga litoralis]|uniref:cupredoxin domain-containing protein n=1 Tax=Aestuariivirga litoralis TaxID=2650924 RepID=UPI0018C5BA98|nr:cupredoxin domain-containing protein [Aestuariivirga litoralis]MBG1231685.1 cupredoxin domain-containing protein [Aestuariivirga litoralis]
MRMLFVAALSVAALTAASVARADDQPVEWKLKGTNFDPPVLKVKAGPALTIKFINENDVAGELECKGLKIEKPVTAGGTIMVKVLNAKPGTYDCVDEPHEDKAKAQIIVE